MIARPVLGTVICSQAHHTHPLCAPRSCGLPAWSTQPCRQPRLCWFRCDGFVMVGLRELLHLGRCCLFQAWHSCFDVCKPTERQVRISDVRIPKKQTGSAIFQRRTVARTLTSLRVLRPWHGCCDISSRHGGWLGMAGRNVTWKCMDGPCIQPALHSTIPPRPNRPICRRASVRPLPHPS